MPDTITIVEIRELFREHFNIKIGRSTLYYYISHKGFPKNTGWGRPRQFDRKKVMRWFEKQKA